MGCAFSSHHYVNPNHVFIIRKSTHAHAHAHTHGHDHAHGHTHTHTHNPPPFHHSSSSEKAEEKKEKMMGGSRKALRKPAKVPPNAWHERLRGGGGGGPREGNTFGGVTCGEHVAAGWPVWLSAVAGEAIRGWIPRRTESFRKLHKIGQGTYSTVYKAQDLESGKFVAMKKVKFDNLEPESVRFMAREILVLRRLSHPNIVRLEGLVTSRFSCTLYLVFEYMEHDLAKLAAAAPTGTVFAEPQVKCCLRQLLLGLEHCHSRGILHRDIKGSNLLLDGEGTLKIADFGLATFCNKSRRKHPLTSRVVTLWYRPPELLLGSNDYGVAVDLWSTGCFLAEMLVGKPILCGRTEVEQIHKIFKLCGLPSEDYWKSLNLPHATMFRPQQPYKRCIAETFKDFPHSCLTLLEKLLAIKPADRGTASSALKSEFFTTKPYACDPSNLLKCFQFKEDERRIEDASTAPYCDLAMNAREFGVAIPSKVQHQNICRPSSGKKLDSLINWTEKENIPIL